QPLFERFSLNHAYDTSLKWLHGSSRRLTNRYMTGSIRDYLIYVFIFFILSLGWALYRTNATPLDLTSFSSVSVYEVVINLVLVVAVLAIPFVKSRLMAIILTGAAGYMVTLFFVLFRAPDLALTQIIVETVSVALFLLCFYHLPKAKLEASKRSFKITNIIIAVSV